MLWSGHEISTSSIQSWVSFLICCIAMAELLGVWSNDYYPRFLWSKLLPTPSGSAQIRACLCRGLRCPEAASAEVSLGPGNMGAVLETFTGVVGETSPKQVLQSPEHWVLQFSGVCGMGITLSICSSFIFSAHMIYWLGLGLAPAVFTS